MIPQSPIHSKPSTTITRPHHTHIQPASPCSITTYNHYLHPQPTTTTYHHYHHYHRYHHNMASESKSMTHVEKVMDKWAGSYGGVSFDEYIYTLPRDNLRDYLVTCSTCTCCARHQVNRPESKFVTGKYKCDHFHGTQDSECYCHCRHNARKIVQVFQQDELN